VLAGCGLQKANLLSVTTAPLAERQVNSQTEPLSKGKFAIKGSGLKTDGLPATGRQITHPSGEGLHDFTKPFH